MLVFFKAIPRTDEFGFFSECSERGPVAASHSLFQLDDDIALAGIGLLQTKARETGTGRRGKGLLQAAFPLPTHKEDYISELNIVNF